MCVCVYVCEVWLLFIPAIIIIIISCIIIVISIIIVMMVIKLSLNRFLMRLKRLKRTYHALAWIKLHP